MAKLAASISNGKANAAKSASSGVPASPEVEHAQSRILVGLERGSPAPERLPSVANVEPLAAPRVQEAAVDAPDERPQAAAPHSAPTAGALSAMPSDPKLLSPATGASVASSFNALATTMFVQNSGQIEQAVRNAASDA